MRIRDIPKDERPREKLKKKGADKLDNSELIAIIIGKGSTKNSAIEIAEKLLIKYGDLRTLFVQSLNELKKENGLGDTKAIQLKACFELSKRISNTWPEGNPVIRSPADIARIFMNEMGGLRKEHFRCLYLDTKNRMTRNADVAIGDLNTSMVHPREVLKIALSESSAAIILVHNHPSGDPAPSPEDVELTNRLKKASEIMGIEILDHVIIGNNRFVSMAEKKLI